MIISAVMHRFLCLSLFMIAANAAENSGTSQTPLLLKESTVDPRRLNVFWNPALNFSKITELSQREVDYALNSDGIVQPRQSEWVTLVTEADNHDSSRRYVMLKKRICSELQFRASYVTSDGVEHNEVMQRLKMSPRPWSMDAAMVMQKLYFNETDGKAYASVNYNLKSSNYPGVDYVKPILTLISCSSIFPERMRESISEPQITEEGRLISFSPAYVEHGCSFSYRLSFNVFENKTECFTLLATPVNESLTIDLACDNSAAGFKCPSPKPQICNVDCEPFEVKPSPKFRVGENRTTQLFVRIDWLFKKPASQGYLVRSAAANSYFGNFIYDADVPQIASISDSSSIELKPFSKQPEAVYALQVCALYDQCQAPIEWGSVKSFPVAFSDYYSIYPIPRPDELEPVLSTIPPTTVATPPVEPLPASRYPEVEAAVPTISTTVFFRLPPAGPRRGSGRRTFGRRTTTQRTTTLEFLHDQVANEPLPQESNLKVGGPQALSAPAQHSEAPPAPRGEPEPPSGRSREQHAAGDVPHVEPEPKITRIEPYGGQKAAAPVAENSANSFSLVEMRLVGLCVSFVIALRVAFW